MASAWTVARLLAVTADYLAGKGVDSPRLDAELLLARILGVDRVSLYIDHDRPVSPAELDSYRELVARRARREPVAYLLGTAAFRYLELTVDPSVLIPRPETEELVDLVLVWLRHHPVLSAGEPAVVDVGTGSGAIALSLASEADVPVLGIDQSPGALVVAEGNAERLGLTGLVRFVQGDLLVGHPPGSLRVVVSNPPYVAEADLPTLQAEVREFEPRAALAGGPDGLEVYRRLVPQAAEALGPGGALFLEVGDGQAERVASLARGSGFPDVRISRDLSGKERIVCASLHGTPRVGLDELGAGAVKRLAGALRAGAIIGLPTDTVYGLAASWESAAGVGRLAQAKGRGTQQPLSVLFSSVDAIAEALPDLDPASTSVLRALLPGPYTFVLGTSASRVPGVGTEDSLGVRVPDHPPLLRLLAALDLPIVATSANPSGEPPPGRLEDVDAGVLSCCAVALVPGRVAPHRSQTGSAAGPPTPRVLPDQAGSVGVASAVVDLRPLVRGGRAVVLRPGAGPPEELLQTIDRAITAAG